MLSPKDTFRLRWNLKQIFFRNFWKFQGEEFLFWIFGDFLKFEKKIENSPKIKKKNIPHRETSKSDSEVPKEDVFCFKFHWDRRMSFEDSIFTVHALAISYSSYSVGFRSFSTSTGKIYEASDFLKFIKAGIALPNVKNAQSIFIFRVSFSKHTLHL